MEQASLKPCPFCGGEVVISLHGDVHSYWYCVTHKELTDCGAFMESHRFEEREDDRERESLAKKWNTRYERTCKYEQPDPQDHPGIWNTECGNHVYWNIDNDDCGLPPDFCPKCGAKVIL